MTTEARVNRRRQPRFAVDGPHGTLLHPVAVEVVNMSLSGLALKADRRLSIGGEYTLRLDVTDRTARVRGLVVWSTLSEVRPNAAGEEAPVYSAGMRFGDVLSRKVTELLAFIDGNKRIPENRLGGLRFHIDAPGKAQLDYPEAFDARVLSLSGMRIATSASLDVESRWPMELFLGGAEDGEAPPLRFTGRVASVNPVQLRERPDHEIGIEFHELARADAARLDSFVRTLASS